MVNVAQNHWKMCIFDTTSPVGSYGCLIVDVAKHLLVAYI